MSSINFIIKDREYNRIIDYLKDEVKGFSNSPELKQLDKTELELPGVVCAAFTKYWIKLEQYSREKDFQENDRTNLKDCYQAIEKMANSEDSEVVNTVVTEIFENIRCDKKLLKKIVNRLGKKSKALYEKWIL